MILRCICCVDELILTCFRSDFDVVTVPLATVKYYGSKLGRVYSQPLPYRNVATLAGHRVTGSQGHRVTRLVTSSALVGAAVALASGCARKANRHRPRPPLRLRVTTTPHPQPRPPPPVGRSLRSLARCARQLCSWETLGDKIAWLFVVPNVHDVHYGITAQHTPI